MKLRIALAQIQCEKGDWSGNLRKAEECMAEAAAAGCDIIVFPEMSLSGYHAPAAATLDSHYIAEFVALTGHYGIAASAGFVETNPGAKPYVTQVLADKGHLVGAYRKVNIEGDELPLFSPGDETPVFELETRAGRVTCALAICADSDRPDIFARFAEKGAKVVFHSSAPGLYGRRTGEASWWDGYNWYKSHLAERLPTIARENNLAFAVATQCGATMDEDFPGGSFVVGANGECLASTVDYKPTLLIYDLELSGSS